MAIAPTDLRIRLSVPTAAAGNTDPQGNVNNSLGGYMSTTDYVDATKNNLFDDLSGDDNANSVVEYRCIFAANLHPTLTWQNVKVWLPTEVAGGASIHIGIDPTPASAINSAGAQAVTVATERTAPAGVAFSNPGTKAAGLTLGDIAPSQCRAIWFRRTAANTVALNNDGVTFQIEGDTAA
jgi:hypothetical protein